jgi:hypothetical protein
MQWSSIGSNCDLWSRLACLVQFFNSFSVSFIFFNESPVKLERNSVEFSMDFLFNRGNKIFCKK